jgi:hypothetical protein
MAGLWVALLLFCFVRHPIEPVIAVLAGVAVANAAQVASRQAMPRLESCWNGGRRVAAAPPRQPDGHPPVERGGALVAPRWPNVAGRWAGEHLLLRNRGKQ